MTNDKLVSVVVSIYNAEKTIERCVNSIINQTYKNLDIILVNDGSKDRSLDLCNDYCRVDERVKVLTKENGGLSSARHYGYIHAKGEYICFIDSDDYIRKNYIEKHLNNFLDTDCDMSICNYILNDGQSLNKITFDYKSNIIEKDSFVSELILPRIKREPTDQTYIPDFVWLRMYRIDLITDAMFISEREVFTEDVFFNFEYLKGCSKVSIIEEPLYFYYLNNKSLTHIYRNNRLEMEIRRVNLLEKYLQYYNCYDRKRILYSKFRSLWGCIENASCLDSYKDYKDELKKMMKNTEIIDMLDNINVDSLSKKERVLLLLCKNKMYFLLYLIKRLR